MSDLDDLKALLDRWGVPYRAPRRRSRIRLGLDQPERKVREIRVTVDHDDGPVIGYSDFFAEFLFDSDGAFVAMGVWE